MTITQTVEIPESRWLSIQVPREVPAGTVILTFTPAKAAITTNIERSEARDIEIFRKYADELNAEALDVLSYQQQYIDL